MPRAITLQPPPADIFADENCTGFHLAQGGTFTLLHFDDGDWRLEITRAGDASSFRLTDADVKHLRAVSGEAVMRAAA